MVVMLRSKKQMIHESHGLLQARMQHRACKEVRPQLPYTIGQTEARCAELSQDLCQCPGIMIGFMSLAIAQVSDGERFAAPDKVIHTRHP